jgi:hypothetical protein
MLKSFVAEVPTKIIIYCIRDKDENHEMKDDEARNS